MSLVDEKNRIQQMLASVEAKLEFCAAVLPSDLVAEVQSCVVRGKEVSMAMAGGPGKLSRMMELFPPRVAQQYLADPSGSAVSREQALSLRTVAAAIPVHPVWLRHSQVLGTAACWVYDLADGVELTLEVQTEGNSEELENLWKGLTRLSNGTSYTLCQSIPERTDGASSTDNPAVLLKEVVEYLNGFIQEHQGRCRGYVPAPVLSRIATEKFGVLIECSVRPSPWMSSVPAQTYGVAVKGPSGGYWHELDKVRQESRQGTLEDILWYDLVP